MINNKIGVINTDFTFFRTGVSFIIGYKFDGFLYDDEFKFSYETVVSKINKFHYKPDLNPIDNSWSWVLSELRKNQADIILVDDIDKGLNEICSNNFEEKIKNYNDPINLVIIKSTINNEFYLALICSHGYLDARGCQSIFHLIIEHYNASKEKNFFEIENILKTATLFETINSNLIVNRLSKPNYNLESNLEALINYPIEDIGEYTIPSSKIPNLLSEFKNKIRKPVNCSVDASIVFKHVKKIHPNVTKNSIITAVLNEALYRININQKGKEKKHIISGRMVSDILPSEMRTKYLGNYIAFVPINTNGESSLAEKAKEINERVIECKTKKLNLSCFQFLELKQDSFNVNVEDNNPSYIITNWNNHRFMTEEEFLFDCKSLEQRGGIKINPIDNTAAKFLSQPIIAINLSFNNQLFISIFPSLSCDEENKNILNEMQKIFNGNF